MHVETTGCAGPGSSAHAPNLREANCINMFNNRIGFGPRLGAALLDLIFIMLLIVPISLLGLGAGIAAALGLDAAIGADEAEAMALVGMGAGAIAMIVVASIIALLYTLIEALTGASPGKRVMGLQVAHADGSEGNIQLYLLRWALKNSGSILNMVLPAISSLVSLVFGLGCFAALGEKKQALHDIIVKSAVFKKGDIVG